jgi:O-antigen ligase
MSALSHAQRAPAGRGLQRLSALAVFATLSSLFLALGAGLAVVSSLFEDAAPLIMLALPLVPILMVAVVAYPLLGGAIVLLTFPVGSLGAPIGFAVLQAVEAAVLVVGMLLILRRLALGQAPLPWAAPLAWALGLLLWMVVALYSAVDEALALKQIISLAGGIVFASIVLAACRNMVDLRRFLAVFTLVGTAIAITALSTGSAENFETAYGGAQVQGRLQGALDHPNQLGSLCALTAPVAAALLLAARTRLGKAASVVALLLTFAALALSLSRGAWIGTAVAFLFLLATLPQARRLLLALSVPLVAISFLVWSLAPTTPETQIVGERARSITVLSPYDDREQIWAEARREIKEHPWTGIGPGGFRVASRRAESESSSVFALHAHNLFLNTGAENGLPAVVLLLAFAGALTGATRRASRRARAAGLTGDRVLTLGVAAGALAIFAQGFVDHTLGNSVVHIALWGLIGALLVARRDAGRPVAAAAAG